MIPFNGDIKTLDDVKAAYPKSFDMNLLTNKRVKIFEKEILQELIDDEIGMCELRDEICPSVISLRKRFAPVAQAKAAYKLLWCGVHLGDQMLKYHWELKDMWTLIRRMQKAGYDPFNTEEDTAAEFIESLPNYGYKLMKINNEKEFFAYNPKGN